MVSESFAVRSCAPPARHLPSLIAPDIPHLLSSRHRSEPAEALAVADAALRSGRVELAELHAQLRTRERGELRWVIRHADLLSESVLESALRTVLIRGGVTGLAAVAAGFVTLRFSWESVLFDPEGVLSSVRSAVARRGRSSFRTAT